MEGITKNTNFHFIAVGGVGMSGLAKFLLEQGYSVSGSDIAEGKYFDKVKALNGNVFLGHKESNLPLNSVVVASTAIKEDNPEFVKAKKNGMKIFHRSDLLSFISSKFQDNAGIFIGFSGTHGKTTTSGLASYVLEKSGLGASFVVGGIIPELDTNAKSTNDKFFIAELDESDGTILKYSPDVTVINNIEVDHVDFYKDGMSSLLGTFSIFLSNLKPNSKVLINNDCSGNCMLMAQNPEHNFITYGLNNADYTARNVVFENGRTSFDVYEKDMCLTNITLSVNGTHNVYNALAVVVALKEAGVDIAKVAEYFTGFCGMGRRYQLVAEVDGVSIIDDYAHHPSEIKATLECAKSCNSEKSILAIFQPHRYSRLHGLYSDFLDCFENADRVIVLDTYAASEMPIGGHTSEDFARDLDNKRKDGSVIYIPGKISEIIQRVSNEIKSGDVVLTLGAGDVTKLGPELAKILEQ